MKTSIRILILSTFLLPFFIIGIWWSLRQFSSPDFIVADSGQSRRESKISLVAVDGSRIPATLVKVETPAQLIQKSKVILLISDLNRDRNWQSKGISPAVGKYIASLLGRIGYDSIRFDMRGTGGNNASRSTQTNPTLHLKDLGTVFKYLEKTGYVEGNILLLAHGEYGCMLALSAVARNDIQASIILLNCAAQGTYLETWGWQLFAKMRQRGVSAKVMHKIQVEWQQFLENGKIRKIKKNTLPDVQAFRNTLQYLVKDDNSDLYQMARHTNLDQKIEQIIAKKQFIYHLVSEFDPDTNEATQEELVHRASRLNSNFYIYKKIKSSDYFLRQSTDNANHLMATVGKSLNPITNIAIDFQKLLIKLLKTSN